MQNKFSVAIKIIGILSILGGIIAFFVFASDRYWLPGIICLLSCIAGGMIIAGIGEIINLLQASYDMQAKIYVNQKDILEKVTDKSKKSDNTNTVDEKLDSVTHSWRCNNCNKMISELPCPYCGDNFNWVYIY